jgi:hypothetical protein
VIVLAVARALLTLWVGVLTRTPRTPARPVPRTPAVVVDRPVSRAARVREGVSRVGGGAYLGLREHGEWAAADPERARSWSSVRRGRGRRAR